MEQSVRALFAWKSKGETQAKRIFGLYKKAGADVTLHGEEDEDRLIELGNERDMSHVLYFIDDEKLLLISLKDEMGGFTLEAEVKDLLLP